MERQDSSFYLIMFPSLPERMRIPPQFLMKVGGVIDRNILVKGRRGGVWEVELEKEDDGLYVRKGWNHFLEDFPVHLKDFLLFSYHSAHELTVQVYGSCGCEKISGYGCVACEVVRKEESADVMRGNVWAQFQPASITNNHGNAGNTTAEMTDGVEELLSEKVILEVTDNNNSKDHTETKKQEDKGMSERMSRRKAKNNTRKRKAEECSMKNRVFGTIAVGKRKLKSGSMLKAGPSKEKIRMMISKIVEKDDIDNSLINVIKKLNSFFGTNLMYMKEEIQSMIKDELLKFVGLDEESEDANDEEENTQPTGGPKFESTINAKQLPTKKISSRLGLAPECIHNCSSKGFVDILNQGGNISGLQKRSPKLEAHNVSPSEKGKNINLTADKSETDHNVLYTYWEDKICLSDIGSGRVIVALKLLETDTQCVIPEVFFLFKHPLIGCASSSICIGCTNEQNDTAIVFLIIRNVPYQEIKNLVDAEAIVIFRQDKSPAEKELEAAKIQQKFHNPGREREEIQREERKKRKVVSDSVLVECLVQLLHAANMTTTALCTLCKELEEHSRIDLSMKELIQKQVELYFQNLNDEVVELNKSDVDVNKRPGRFIKLCRLSSQPQKAVGELELARTEVMKRIQAVGVMRLMQAYIHKQ